MFKKLFLAMFLLSSLPVTVAGCSKDEKKTEDSDKKKKDDSDDEDDSKSKKKKKKSEDSDEDDSKSKKKKKTDDDEDSKKDEDGDSKKKDDTASDEESTGIKECDAYLTRYMKCMPGDKTTKADTVKKLRKAYKEGAAVAAAKPGLTEGCEKANEGLDKVPGCK